MRRSCNRRAAWPVLLVLSFLAPSNAGAFPAFARKYGLRCSACHEAWAVLNDFGVAFRDNGYQIMLGKDNMVTTERGYIPFSIRLTPQYVFSDTTNQQTDQGKRDLKTGAFQTIGMDFLTGGALFDNVSALVVPTGFTPSAGVFLESFWLRFDNLWDSPWVNIKFGRHEVDLPASAHRALNLTPIPYLFYGYHPAGSMSQYSMSTNQIGMEYIGHDRGSANRVGVSVFDVTGTPGSGTAFDTPAIYGHATHEWHFDEGAVSAVMVGAFGAYTTWPTTSLTQGGTPIPGTGGGLKPSTREGAELHAWFGPAATPFHVTLVYGHGADDQGLIPNATQNGSYNGGFLEAFYTFSIKNTLFFRYDMIRNSQQAIPGSPANLNDQDGETLGLRHTFQFSNHTEYALHVEVSTLNTKGTAFDGSDVRNKYFFAGLDFAY
jgi:hypothetical protein